MKQNKRFELSNLYFITGVGWGKIISSDYDYGMIGYKGLGESAIPFKVIHRLTLEARRTSLVELLIECIKHDQEIKFEEV